MVQPSTTIYYFIATLAITGLAATVSDVTSGVNDIISKIAALNTLFNNVTDGSPVTPDIIDNLIAGCQALSTTTDQVASDIEGVSTFQLASAAISILPQFQKIQSTIVSALTAVIAKKQVLATSPASAKAIAVELTALNKSSANFWKALTDKSPVILHLGENLIQQSFESIFEKAIQAYSS